MRVLGVDPGLTRCGIGVVDGGPRGQLRCAGVGVVRSAAQQDLAERLRVIADGVEEWLEHHRPDVVVVDQPACRPVRHHERPVVFERMFFGVGSVGRCACSGSIRG